jgi:hypothetical protein
LHCPLSGLVPGRAFAVVGEVGIGFDDMLHLLHNFAKGTLKN